jgi:hypothetical protein
MNQPTLAGFLSFLRNIAGINATVLPDSSPVIEWAFNFSMNTVSGTLQVIPQVPDEFLYITAVYNLATHTVLVYGQDQTGQTFFSQVQQKYQLKVLVPGVVQAASDESTSSTMLNPDAFKGLTLANLGQLKTPYGQTYLSIIQDLGSLSLLGIA